jgi:hypothetical protein
MTKRGNPKLGEVANKDTSAANAARMQRADAFALEIAELLYEEGVPKAQFVSWLNAKRKFTRKGNPWTRFAIRRLFKRLDAIRQGQRREKDRPSSSSSPDDEHFK